MAVGWIDKTKLRENNIKVSYCPGCNSHAVSEWVIAMTLLLMRKFHDTINTSYLENKSGSEKYLGLYNKSACILGKGNIGTKVGTLYESLGIRTIYFEKGNDLLESTRNCDIIVNTLSSNSTTEGLLNSKFFRNLKIGSVFLTVTSSKIYDTDAMIETLSKGILGGIADDCGSILPGNYDDPYYKKLLKIPNAIATPHISYQSDVTIKIGNDMMINNVEAYIKGKPINLVK